MDWLQLLGPALGLANAIALVAMKVSLAKKPVSQSEYDRVYEARLKALEEAEAKRGTLVIPSER